MGVLSAFMFLVSVVVVFFVTSGKGPLGANRARHNRPSRSKTNELGSGDLARKAHIIPWLQHKDPLGTSLPVRELKGSDGIACKKGFLTLPVNERNRHVLVIAKTGSGKTTRAIMPVLYQDCLCPHRSTIVIDSKPEMWDKLAGIAKLYNPKKKLLLFNPLDTARSLSWNILGKIESDTDAKLIANTIVTATDNPNARADSPFFRNSALQLLNSMMVGLLTDKQERLSMPRVHELLNSGMSNLCDWIEAHPFALRNSKTFVDLARSGSQNADTILSELSTRLAAWDLSTIRSTTAFDELDLECLIQEPCLFVVELRESELEMLRPMANVIVIEVLRYLTKRAEQLPGQTLPRPVSVVIDEFASSLGRLPDIHVKLNTLRSRNVSIVAAIQSIAQVKANYDRDADSVLAGFSTKIFMPSLDFMDAEWASKETGTMTVRFNVASTGKNRRVIDFFAHRNDNLQEQVQQRAVLTPDEIGRPTDNAATFFLPNTPVFQGHLVPYFEVPEMRDRFERGSKLDVSLRDRPIDSEVVGRNEATEVSVTPAPARAPAPAPAEQIEDAEIVPRAKAAIDAPAAKSNGPAGAPSGPSKQPETLPELKNAVGFQNADRATKDWWISLEQKNAGSKDPLIMLLKEVYRRRINLAEFRLAYEAASLGEGKKDLKQLLRDVDRKLLEAARAQLHYDSAPEDARRWWDAFENVNDGDLVSVRELTLELARRSVKLEDVFRLYAEHEPSSLVELLKVIDDFVAQRAASTSPPAQTGSGAYVHG